MVTERAAHSGLGFQWDWGWGRSRTPPLKRSACLGGLRSGQQGPVLGSVQPGNEFSRTSPPVSCIVRNRRGHGCLWGAELSMCGKGSPAHLDWGRAGRAAVGSPCRSRGGGEHGCPRAGLATCWLPVTVSKHGNPASQTGGGLVAAFISHSSHTAAQPAL